MFSFSRRKKVKSKAVAVLKEVNEEGSYVEPPLELEESDDLDHRKEIVHEDLDQQGRSPQICTVCHSVTSKNHKLNPLC